MSDQQNVVLAIVLSIVVLLGFQFLYVAPQQERLAEQQAAQAELAQEQGDGPTTPAASNAPNETRSIGP